MSAFRIVPAGDSAMIVEFEDRIDAAINAQALAVAGRLQAQPVAGVRDVVPTYRSVAVYFDPLQTSHDALMARLGREAAHAVPEAAPSRDEIRIPVCYGGELGPDLADVAAFGGISESAAVDLHLGMTYRVFMLGFMPGFAYLGIVNACIAAPRRETPRVRVPRGAVGIAGFQTGVHPVEAPSGWQLIGRTPVRPFDPARAEPFLMKPGDAVRFYQVDRAEFDRMAQASRAAD
jgi:KipI family sensor histidine kinase inhibitor